MLFALVFGLFGLILGSFLNVVILRHGALSIRGRSRCLSCGQQLRATDMVPLVSWLLLAGRCRTCGSAISIQYPLVEATTALLFALVGFWLFIHPLDIRTIMLALIYLALIAVLLCVAVYDLRHTIIPDAWVYVFSALALSTVFLTSTPYASNMLLALLAGPLATLPLLSLFVISRGRWMGFGDVKLSLGIGWLLGPLYGVVAVFFAFVIGSLISLPLVFLSSQQWKKIMRFTPTAISKRLLWGYTMKSEVPFGPFLVASCLIIWLSLMYHVPLPLSP